MTNKRDAGVTRQRIIDAAVQLLGKTGIEGLGVNALAQAAGVDKVLIYRYFGGLDGVIDELGANLQLWLGEELARAKIPIGPYAQVMARLVTAYLHSLRSNPALRALLTASPGPASDRLAAARTKAIGEWFALARASAGPPAVSVDAPAVNAILIAAVQYLTVREDTGEANGLDLSDPVTWHRIETALANILSAMHPPPG